MVVTAAIGEALVFLKTFCARRNFKGVPICPLLPNTHMAHGSCLPSPGCKQQSSRTHCEPGCWCPSPSRVAVCSYPPQSSRHSRVHATLAPHHVSSVVHIQGQGAYLVDRRSRIHLSCTHSHTHRSASHRARRDFVNALTLASQSNSTPVLTLLPLRRGSAAASPLPPLQLPGRARNSCAASAPRLLSPHRSILPMGWIESPSLGRAPSRYRSRRRVLRHSWPRRREATRLSVRRRSEDVARARRARGRAAGAARQLRAERTLHRRLHRHLRRQ